MLAVFCGHLSVYFMIMLQLKKQSTILYYSVLTGQGCAMSRSYDISGTIQRGTY